jgi:aspartate racemase
VGESPGGAASASRAGDAGGVGVKTIGVLGGLGPQATMDLEARIHRAARRLIPPDRNGGYPPMVVFYCRHPPMRVDDRGRPLHPVRVDPRLLDAARVLGGLADFLVVPSNGVHLFGDQIERASGRRLVSMVDATIRDVRRREWRSVGVLGLGRPVVYTEPLGRVEQA